MFKAACALALIIPLSTQAGTTVEPVQIYDGDSFKVTINDWPEVIGKNIDIRLKGADAPDFSAKCDKERELAQQASDFAWNFIIGAQKVELVEIERDHYFRLLARIQADGKDLSTALIDAGLAKPYDGGPILSWCEEPESEQSVAELGIPT